MAGIVFISFSFKAAANLEIFCPKEKSITYQQYLNGNYYDRPVIWGAHTLYGPWIKSNLNCGAGYVTVKWEIVDHYARTYYCTQTIWVENAYGGSPVSVWCPKEQTIYCDEVDYVQYLKPEISGYNYKLYGPYISKSINDCGTGSLWVEWKIIDGCGKTTYCKTAIWVKARSGYPNIWWPKDFEADPCKDVTDPRFLPYPFGYPEISSYNKCAKYGISYKDEEYTFPNDPGICRKIVRRWSVIDWCNYNPNSYGHSQSGRWEHVQLIKIINKSAPTIICTPEVKVNQELYGKTAWVDIPIPKATSTCNGAAIISHNSKYATRPGADASGQYPIGTTDVIFTVKDPCSNFSSCTTKVIVLDKTLPTPYCIAHLVAGIGWHSDGIYTIIDPKKFDAGSFDNCTPREKLRFEAQPFRYNCDSIGIRTLKIWVIDEAGNKDFCIVKLSLQDNQGMCPKKVEPAPPQSGTLLIAGLLLTIENNPLDSVAMQLIDSSSSKNIMTSGKYKFTSLYKGKSYTVKPFKGKDFLDGVTNEDYNLLINYIQGREILFNPYQLLAADIDGNDTIDMDDAFLLGYYLLKGNAGVPGTQPSWRFASKSFDLSLLDLDSKSIAIVPKQILYKKLDSIDINGDFVGIKIGDLDLSIYDTVSTVSTKSKNQLETRQPATIAGTILDHKVFPNPFHQKVSILFHVADEGNFDFSLYNIQGQKVFAQSLYSTSGLNQFELSATAFNLPGIYFYTLQDNFKSFSGKLVYKP